MKMSEKPHITREDVGVGYDNKYLKLYELGYVKERPYMNASRRELEHLVATKSEEEFKKMLPDAVSCVVILKGEEPKLLLSSEFRYPVGQFLLSVPAGLIDKADYDREDAVIATAIRELKEETNIDFTRDDIAEIINPLLFSTPGMTDESNALVKIVITDPGRLEINQDGAEGTECFNGYSCLTLQEAKRILKQGRDDEGFFYSIFTWAALMYFVTGMWQE